MAFPTGPTQLICASSRSRQSGSLRATRVVAVRRPREAAEQPAAVVGQLGCLASNGAAMLALLRNSVSDRAHPTGDFQTRDLVLEGGEVVCVLVAVGAMGASIKLAN
jgi:hypothetical protein